LMIGLISNLSLATPQLQHDYCTVRLQNRLAIRHWVAQRRPSTHANASDSAALAPLLK
jgi:hypothetical protein